MKVTSLSSGSKGNASVVVGEYTTVLVDIGIGIKLLQENLRTLNLSVDKINALIISHEHSDHICGLESLIKHNPSVEIYANALVWGEIIKKYPKLASINAHLFDYDTPFSVGEFSVLAMENFHDSISCASFILSQNNSRVGFCTDLGIITDYQVDMLSSCKVVFLECNHDPQMLASCGYPYILKQRISSTNGHLSNSQCAIAALKMVQNQTKVVVLSHISENSNLPEKAYSVVADTFAQNGIENVHILLGYPKKMGKTITIK